MSAPTIAAIRERETPVDPKPPLLAAFDTARAAAESAATAAVVECVRAEDRLERLLTTPEQRAALAELVACARRSSDAWGEVVRAIYSTPIGGR